MNKLVVAVIIVSYAFLAGTLWEIVIPPKTVIRGTQGEVTIWLHGYGQSAKDCPDLGGITIAPEHRPVADWENYNIRRLLRWVPKGARIEGFSRGAYGAAYHASMNPGVFSSVTCVAGYYPDYPQVTDPLVLKSGALDKWRHSTVQYAKNLGQEIEWTTGRHNMKEYYSVRKLK